TFLNRAIAFSFNLITLLVVFVTNTCISFNAVTHYLRISQSGISKAI
ncbi:hypothetical protein D041_3930B, partial [Vibrio parahaemolyticus EKP-008]